MSTPIKIQHRAFLQVVGEMWHELQKFKGNDRHISILMEELPGKPVIVRSSMQWRDKIHAYTMFGRMFEFSHLPEFLDTTMMFRDLSDRQRNKMEADVVSARQEPEKPVNPIALARDWLARYEGCVRHRDYTSVKALFHTRTICFGLATDLTVDVDDMIANEWKQVWPSQVAFTFDMGRCSIIPDGSMIAIAIPWECRSVVAGAPAKRGRATIVLVTFTNNKTLCVHLHMSDNAKVAIV